MKCKKSVIILLTVVLTVLLSSTTIHAVETDKFLLETIGHFSGQTLYLSYISIGTIADGHAKEVYDDAVADELLAKTIGLCKGSVDQLNKLLSSGALGGEDISYVNGLIDTFTMLSAQASGYRNFVKTKDSAHIKVFTAKRKAAWENITKLLGFKE